MPVAEFPTLNVIAEELSERLVTVYVDEVVGVGAVGDEFPPQVTVTTVAMTVARKPMRRVVTSISFHSRRRGDQFYSTVTLLARLRGSAEAGPA